MNADAAANAHLRHMVQPSIVGGEDDNCLCKLKVFDTASRQPIAQDDGTRVWSNYVRVAGESYVKCYRNAEGLTYVSGWSHRGGALLWTVKLNGDGGARDFSMDSYIVPRGPNVGERKHWVKFRAIIFDSSGNAMFQSEGIPRLSLVRIILSDMDYFPLFCVMNRLGDEELLVAEAAEEAEEAEEA